MKRYAGLWFPDDEGLSVEFRRLIDQPQGYHGDRLAEALEQVTDFSCAIEVGAHVGMWTRKLAGRFERVLAFEPDPASAECLVANTRELGNVEIHEYALGEQQGRARIEPAKGRVGSHLVPGEPGVLVDRLDNGPVKRCGYMKVHANGYELPVLRGAAETIRRCRPVLTVVFKPKPQSTARYGYGAAELEAFVTGLGYKPGRGQKPYRVFVPA